MIISNGYINGKIKAVSGIDPSTGYPLKAKSEWSEPIPCQYIAKTYNALNKSNGEHYTLQGYQILIDEQEFEFEQVRLTNNNGKVVGEFSIKQIEPLVAVCQISITV